MTQFFVTNLSVWNVRLMTGFCQALGAGFLGRRRDALHVEDLPTGFPEALVSLNPTGGFQLFKRPVARLAECGSLVRKLLKRRHPL
jgi:hypothetical protein